MSVSAFMTRRATVEAHYGSHQAFTSLVPIVDQMYQCVRSHVQQSVGPEVVRIRYDTGEDWSGERAVFFAWS